MQQELRHRALRAGVDGFRGAEEANPQANEFLDAADAVGDAAISDAHVSDRDHDATIGD